MGIEDGGDGDTEVGDGAPEIYAGRRGSAPSLVLCARGAGIALTGGTEVTQGRLGTNFGVEGRDCGCHGDVRLGMIEVVKATQLNNGRIESVRIEYGG